MWALETPGGKGQTGDVLQGIILDTTQLILDENLPKLSLS